MIIEYVGVKEISGSLIVLDGVKGASFEETVTLRLENYWAVFSTVRAVPPTGWGSCSP